MINFLLTESSSITQVCSSVDASDMQPGTLDEHPTKFLRSAAHVVSRAVSSGSHILPRECIICCKTQYRRDPISRKNVKEKLSQCETLKAGCLIDAAQRKNDEVNYC